MPMGTRVQLALITLAMVALIIGPIYGPSIRRKFTRKRG